MPIDLISILNETNSIKNQCTNEIIITSQILQVNDKFQINSSCRISSNCNTVIKSDLFEILAPSVFISNISFETVIFIHDTNNVSISNSSISQAKNSYGSITIFNSKNILLNNITITNIIDIPGIFVYNNSTVVADHLFIHNIIKSFIAINSKSFVSIKDSKFHHTNRNAIYLADQSSIEIYNCSFSHITYPSFFFVDSRCIIKNNTFDNISENAIVIKSSKDFVIEKNNFNLIGDTAIQISDESVGIIKDNTIYNVKGNGIYCHNSDIKIENNDLYEITYPAIALSKKSKSMLLGNKIMNVKCSGICARHAKEVKIENCKIKDIKESGISISDTENCIIQNNLISNCIIASIEAYNKSNVIIQDNLISNIQNNAFLVYTSGYMKVENNSISDVKNEMVKLSYKGSGDFINNKILNCCKQCECKTSSSFFFNGNGDFKSITNDPSRISSDNLINLVDPYEEEDDTLCIKCHSRKRNCFLLDCGHKAFCQECAELALKNNECCPICRFNIVKVSNGFGSNIDDTCMICCESKSDCIILPCGHMGVCIPCLENWLTANQSCPICRSQPCIYKPIIHDY